MRGLARLTALVSVASALSLIPAQAADAADCVWLANPSPGTPLYIRSGPGTGYQIVAQLSKGEEFYGSCSGAWISINTQDAPFHWNPGTHAYANSRYATKFEG
jgi:uncharacterized protein YraI